MIAFSLFVTLLVLKQSERTARRSPLIQVRIIFKHFKPTGKKKKQKQVKSFHHDSEDKYMSNKRNLPPHTRCCLSS